jgi:hypothetical protein
MSTKKEWEQMVFEKSESDLIDEWEMAEANCKCGWYGSADSLVYDKELDKRFCPICDEVC